MLPFTIFMEGPSEDHYLSTKEKYQTLYASSSCIFI